ncbi:MAG: Hsp20/alpha crystallin family protein [Dehalococcoidales bacterium]|nr:Hsp20/alpha crystallin family protein [Dehalococcoidales bacterium]
MTTKLWNPLQEMRMMENLANRLWQSNDYSSCEDWNISLDVMKKGDTFAVAASLPGIDAKDIDVSIEDNVLTIRAERKDPAADDKEITYLVNERPVGSFYRALRLPETIDTSKIQSSYKDCVL